MLDEVFIIGSKIFSFINLRLRFIKHTHSHFFGNMDVIITCDIYQTQPF
jgi:hypothetical protein